MLCFALLAGIYELRFASSFSSSSKWMSGSQWTKPSSSSSLSSWRIRFLTIFSFVSSTSGRPSGDYPLVSTVAAVPVLCASVDPAVKLDPLLDSSFVSSMSDSGVILDYEWLPLSSSSSSSIISLLLFLPLRDADDCSSFELKRLVA